MSNSEDDLNLQQQQERLDDTDIYAFAWADALEKYRSNSSNGNNHSETLSSSSCWGGRGQGGRGLARRTYQRYDCSVPNVTLEYLGSHTALLDNAHLKLLAGHTYGLIGANGKSTLLRRIQARKIPGFPPHLSTLYLHRDDLLVLRQNSVALDSNGEKSDTGGITASSWLCNQHGVFTRGVKQDADTAKLERLQEDLEKAIEEEDEDLITSLAEQMASIEDDDGGKSAVMNSIFEQLNSIQIAPDTLMHDLSPGQQQLVLLSLIPLCKCNVFLLDNPTANLDISGLLMLRALIAQVSLVNGGTVVVATGDVDLLNDVATDIICIEDRKLCYYNGNYKSFVKQREQLERGKDRQTSTMEKKQIAMKQRLDNLRRQPIPKRGGTKKKARQLSSHKKRMDRELANGDPSVALMKQKQRYEHEKAIQFRFPPCLSKWNEPLIIAADVEFKRASGLQINSDADKQANNVVVFDSVDFCVKEGATHILLGEMASGKTTLLRILAKSLQPTAGDVIHAPALNVALIGRECLTCIPESPLNHTPQSFMAYFHPHRSAQDIREQLAYFGLGPTQGDTALASLSDGEMFRLNMSCLTFHEVHVLILDDPTSFLDADSIDALLHGLDEWNGTLIVSSHDGNFVRSLPYDSETFALLPQEQKLRKVQGGIDEYLRSYSNTTRQ